MVKYADSLTKIGDYLQRLEVDRYDVYLSPTFFRSLICRDKCGACCPKFTLDYITEDAQRALLEFYSEVYSTHFKYRLYKGRYILSDLQEDNLGVHCRFLDENARCKIHGANPLSCRVEPIKFRLVKNRVYIGKYFFGRAWNMTRIDGEKGCLCVFKDYTEEQFQSDIQILKELNEVADFFGVETVLPQVIDLLEELGPEAKLKKKIRIQTAGVERLDKWR